VDGFTNNFNNDMDNDNFEVLERRLTSLPLRGAPPELRETILATANRELAAARWDRRLVRAAAMLFLAGVCMNAAIGWQSPQTTDRQPSRVADARSQESLIQAAVVVAQVTDAATGNRYARQLAAMTGRELTDEEAASIDAAIERASNGTDTNGSRG
jgi:hypothetical protein